MNKHWIKIASMWVLYRAGFASGREIIDFGVYGIKEWVFYSRFIIFSSRKFINIIYNKK